MSNLYRLLLCLAFTVSGVAQASDGSKRLHPEISDPVLGDRAAIVEWAWSPQYAKFAGLPEQTDGLKDGHLWLVGIKIFRAQAGAKDYQTYRCTIAGLIDNKAKFIKPPGDRYASHPGHPWVGGLPGKVSLGPADDLEAEFLFSPAIANWYLASKGGVERASSQITPRARYLSFVRQYTETLSYFEIESNCSYFGEPSLSRTELRFPTRVAGVRDKTSPVREAGALTFQLPSILLERMRPHLINASDWGSCLKRRVDARLNFLTSHALKTKRFGISCEPKSSTVKYDK